MSDKDCDRWGFWPLVWYWIVYAGYVIRPYDMLCDRRRWFWQERTACRRWNGNG